MGVSLQVYRVRIGTFYPTVRVKTGKEQFEAEIKQINWNYGVYFIAFLLISCSIASCNISQYPLSQCKPGLLSPTQSEPPLDPYLCQNSDFCLIPSSWLTLREINAYMRAMHGNRANRGRGIKIIAWNKGNSFLQNKHHEIEALIAADRPHILGLSEANLKKETDLSCVQHDEYTLHTAPTLQNHQLGISRMVVYTHSSLVVKRRHDLEHESISAIWLELGMPRQKKIIVGNVYREWQHMGQGPNNTTGSIAAQLQRWIIFIDMWEKALGEGKEVLVLGDINIDFLKWTQSNLPVNDSSVRLKQLNDQLFSRIFPLGVSQLVSTPTRVSPSDPPSGLDHIYSNKPEKCSDVRVEFNGGSDHKVLKITRFSKSEVRSSRYVRKRSYKNFCATKFCEAVKQLSWFDLYMCDCPTQAATILTGKISDILDIFAPVKTFQVRRKYAAWLSDNTKELIKLRNEAQLKAQQNNDQDHWREYKN